MRYRAAALSLLALVLVGSLFLSAPLAQTTSDENVVFSKDYTVGWIHLLLAYDSFRHAENEAATLRITRLRTDKDIRGGLLLFNGSLITEFRSFVRGDEEVIEKDVTVKAGTNSFILYLRGDKNSSIRIEVVTQHEVPAPTASLTSSAESITYGDSLELSWATENAETITIEPGLGAVDASGNTTVSPTEDTTYTLTATGPGGEAQASVSVDVRSAVEPQPKGSFGENYEDLVPPDAQIEAYDPDRFAVVTGFVNDIAGAPLPGVEVTVHDDEALYGTARTDETGRFAIPVEGGGLVTVNYHKDGYIDAHRQANVPWNDFAMTETVALIVEDTVTTTVVPDGNPAHSTTHRSSVNSDEDGTRAATVVFPGDVKAYRVEDNGTETELPSFTVRVTEYPTPESMPAVLPPTSAFTWCAEFTVDGAEHVRFDKPVVGWLENFLDFPVGAIVPSGYYDREKAVWVPTENGLVVELLDTDGDGIVDALDATGDGVADDIDGDGVLGDEVLGLEDASVYAPGATFWRVRMEHFSPFDWNWPWRDFLPPSGDYSPPTATTPPPCKDCPKDWIASNVSQRGGNLSESFLTAGAAVAFNYSSERSSAPKHKVIIPLTGAFVSEDTLGVNLRIDIAGKEYRYSFGAEPNQEFVFVWDGLDYLGQRVRGDVYMGVNVAHIRDVAYGVSLAQNLDDAFFESFFGVPKSQIASTSRRRTYEQYKFSRIHIAFPDQYAPEKYDAGHGWLLDNHHELFKSRGAWTLAKGTGEVIPAERMVLEEEATIYAGMIGENPDQPSKPGPWMEGMNATRVELFGISSLATAPNGDLYISSQDTLLKVKKDGTIYPIAGYNATWDPYSDNVFESGTPASDIPMPSWGIGVTVSDNGDVYAYWKESGGRIVKIEEDGTATVVAGTYGYNDGYADGQNASSYTFNDLGSVDIGANGCVYFIENNTRVRFITPDGKIHTLAGGGAGYPNNVLGIDASLNGIEDLYVDASGCVYVGGEGNVYRITDAGVIQIVENKPENLEYLFARDTGFTSNGDRYYINHGDSTVRVLTTEPPVNYAGEVYPDGTGMGYVFDEANRHVATIDMASRMELEHFEYDTNGRLSRIVDRFGNAVTIERGSDGAPIAIIDSDGHRTGMDINAHGDLIAVHYPDGGTLRFEYDDSHRMIAKIDQEGNRYEFQYSEQGRIDQVVDSEGGVWHYERTAEDGMPITTRTTAEGEVVKTKYKEDDDGSYTTVVDSSGGMTETFTSGDGRYVESQLPCGTTLKAYYRIDTVDRNLTLSKSVRSTPSGRESESLNWKSIYTNDDGVTRLIWSSHTTNGYGYAEWIYPIDGLRVVLTGEDREIIEEYDPTTLLTSRISVPGLFDTTYKYDARGRVTDVAAGNRTASYTYDGQGNVATVTDAQNRTTSFTYDAMDRVTSVTRPDDSTMHFAWDKNGNLDVLTVPSNVDHTFAYNKVDKNTAYDPPISPSYQYEYDRDRRLVRTVFPSGAAIENVYENGQLRRVKTPEGDVVMDYLCSSKIGTITMGTEFLNFEYDGPLLTSLEQAGELNSLLTFGYDDTMQLEAFGYAGGAVDFTYGDDGLLIGIGDFTIERDADNGLPLAVDDQTARLERIFNGYGEVERQTLSVAGNAVGEVVLTRDDVGQIIAKTETIDGAAYEYEYEYDDFGRLTTVRDGTGSELERYTYGPQGERLTETNVLRGIVSRSFTYDDEDRLLTAGEVNYTFDADGFLTSKTEGSETTTYDYSSRGELKQVELPDGKVVEYRHDPMGRRVAKLVDGEVIEQYLWLGRTKLLAVHNGDGSLKSRFLYADDRMPMGMVRDGEMYYFVYDQVGSLRAVTGATGAVIKTVRYDSFGNIIDDSNPDLAVPFGFAGGLHDSDTGIVRFGFRDYDPDTGRWTARDPIGFAAGDTNLYGYVQNDPVGWLDPSGLQRGGGSRYASENGLRMPLAEFEYYSLFEQIRRIDPNFSVLRNADRNIDFRDVDSLREHLANAEIENLTRCPPRPPSGFKGMRGFQLSNAPYQRVRNFPDTINDREYSGHALDQMQNRGIMPSIVDNAIATGQSFPTGAGTTGYYDSINNIRVITNSDTGRVITVY